MMIKIVKVHAVLFIISIINPSCPRYITCVGGSVCGAMLLCYNGAKLRH